MARERTNDPEALAAILAALRAFASDRAPTNDCERAIVSGLQGAGADPNIAQRMVANFDRIAPSVRARVLGEFGPPGFTPQQRQAVAPTQPARRRLVSATGSLLPRTLDYRQPGGLAPGAVVAPDDAGVFLDPPPPQARYTIKYVGFYCDEEVGDQGDIPGFNDTAEEVYLITSAVHISANGQNVVRTEKHPVDRLEYEGVDTGSTRLGPIAACWAGVESDFPVSLTVVGYERDYGDPNYYKEEIDDAVTAAVEAAKWFLPGGSKLDLLDKLSDLAVDLVNGIVDTDDDQVDKPRTLILTQQSIERMGRLGRKTYWDTVKYPFGGEDTFPTDLTCHFWTRHSGLGGLYVFGFDVERVPAFVEDPQGGVD